MEKFAIIVAAGAGTRMGSNLPKQFLLLNSKPIIWHSANAFLQAFEDIRLILVLPANYIDMATSILETLPLASPAILINGGDTRFQSVKNGLDHCPPGVIVFIHDGVRCLATPALIQRCYNGAVQQGNAIPAITAIDSLRIETMSGNKILDRSKVKIIQTPQTFQSDIIKPAFEVGYRDSFTDEASVVENIGHQINLVEGEITNLKITNPVDLLIAEQLLNIRAATTKAEP